MNIETKINELIKEKGKTVVVLEGFDVTELSKKLKYFLFEIDYFDKVDMDRLKQQVVEEMIVRRNFDEEYLWMTIEEYQLFKINKMINNMPVIILKNNLYNKQYPYRSTLSNVEAIYHYLYYQEDNELEPEQVKVLENVSMFYGQIDFSKSGNCYYVTYPENDKDIQVLSFYEEEEYTINLIEDAPEDNMLQVELSENELPFLDLTMLISESNIPQDILFILSGSESTSSLPNHYLTRLSILSTLTQRSFYFTTVSIKRKIIEREKDYFEILNKTYGSDKFREIDFYKNIKNRSKEIIRISQAQIIDDIVTQAEKAMHGEDFQDVYITSSTGSGKSIMFQIPALYLSKKYCDNKPLTLVISPLIGLMNDQVDSMKRKGVSNSATINGNTPPYEKEKILEQVQNQEVDVLYLSPETLQARSDIKMLIGDRNIGVVIIDEAHIVTTWGKSFRADYWYLGIYLAKLRKQYKFPIVTFTATAIYGGREDMYMDTRNSLNMISPISYFGNVRRDDLMMNVKSSEREFDNEGRDYRKTKMTLLVKHLQTANKKNKKSLVYFPTIKLLLDSYSFLMQNAPEIAEKTGKYYGTLSKEEKDEVLLEYKEGELQFVFATKAFGMGIDIPDITYVYHYSPTGNVVDYIQEIGRAARDKNKVKNGCGMINFLKKDMNEVKQLYGMSAIKKTQLIELMRKILSIYKEKGNNRNLIISPEDFKYIFVQNKKDEDSLDNKVKTALLMIEKDFSSPNKLGYSPFVARPRSLFGNDLIFVTPKLENELMKSRLAKYFEKLSNITGENYSAIYQVDLSSIWEKYYRNMSFPKFKYALFNSEEREWLQHKNIFEKFIYTTGVNVAFTKDKETILSEYKIIMESFQTFVNQNKIRESQFTVTDLGNHFMKTLKISDKFEARSFAQVIINAAFEFSKIKEIKFIKERTNSSDNNARYIIYQDGDMFTEFVMNGIRRAVNPSENYIEEPNEGSITSFHLRANGEEIDAKIAALGIGEARHLLNYQIIGGNNPQIYLRMNSVYPLEKAIKEGDFYKNTILEDVQTKHYTSVEMLKYLFTKDQSEKKNSERIENYTKWFWDNIEDYFMGVLPERVKETLARGKQ